jgi:hypothetical protein
MNEARWFTNQISDLAEGTVTVGVGVQTQQKSTQHELTLVFEEVHTLPTGYKPAKVIAKVAA